MNLYDFGLHDWFPYEYRAGKLSRISGSAPIVLKLADGTEEKVTRIQSIRSIYRKEFPTRGMSFGLPKWLGYSTWRKSWTTLAFRFLEHKMRC